MIPAFSDLDLVLTAPRPLPEERRVKPFIQADLTDFDQCQRLIAEAAPDVILAVGAIPSPTDSAGTREQPGKRPFDATMRVNIMGLYYLMMAAVEAKVRAVIFTGSNVTVLDGGGNYRYLPLDDQHPDSVPSNSYNFSKRADDLMLAWFTRAYGIQTISTRPGWMHSPQQMQDLAKNVKPATRWDNGLWQYIAYEDVALGHRQIFDTLDRLPPHDTYLLGAADHRAMEDSRELVEKFCPPELAKTVPEGFSGRQAFINCQKAHNAFGFQAQRSWTDYA